MIPKIKQVISVDNGFVALAEDGSLWHIYQIIDITTGIKQWTWSQIN